MRFADNTTFSLAFMKLGTMTVEVEPKNSWEHKEQPRYKIQPFTEWEETLIVATCDKDLDSLAHMCGAGLGENDALNLTFYFRVEWEDGITSSMKAIDDAAEGTRIATASACMSETSNFDLAATLLDVCMHIGFCDGVEFLFRQGLRQTEDDHSYQAPVLMGWSIENGASSLVRRREVDLLFTRVALCRTFSLA